MSKLEKLNKIRISLIILIVLLLIGMIITIFILAMTSKKIYKTGNITRGILNYNCLKKGEVCTEEDIINSIKVSIPVNEKEIYDFYLISNDKDYATFIMASNLKNNVDWHIEEVNFRGPTKAYRELMALTKDWTYIDPIEDFSYEDAGNYYYHRNCDTIADQANNLIYDCRDNITPARAYQKLEILEDGLHIKMNLPKGSAMDEDLFYEGTLYARLPSYEDISDISPGGPPDWIIDNLEEHSGYWTMTSSTFPTLNYNKAAFAVLNKEGNGIIREMMTLNEAMPNYNIGIRPVITLKK